MTVKGLGYFVQKRRCENIIRITRWEYKKTGKEGNYELHTGKARGFS